MFPSPPMAVVVGRTAVYDRKIDWNELRRARNGGYNDLVLVLVKPPPNSRHATHPVEAIRESGCAERQPRAANRTRTSILLRLPVLAVLHSENLCGHYRFLCMRNLTCSSAPRESEAS